MATLTRLQFLYAVQNALDSTGTDTITTTTSTTPRFSADAVKAIGGNVFDEEWAGILDQNQVYRFNAITGLTTDSSGRIATSGLTTGSGDTAKNFYRVLSGFSDGNVLYRETDYRNVPLATVTNYNAPWDYLFYLAGSDYFQLLPVASGTTIQTWVSWTPTSIPDLSADASVIDFPAGSEYLLVWQTAAKLLAGKGGSEAGAAQVLFGLADDARKSMLAGVGRLTTRPNFMLFQDTAGSWGG